MAAIRVVSVLFLLVSVNCEYVTRKHCNDVDVTRCQIHSVRVDPCPAGPGFCELKSKKAYGLTVDFTPGFSAEDVKLSVTSDDQNTNTFARTLRVSNVGCLFTRCPLEAGQRQDMELDFTVDKSVIHTKFPIKVKFWNNGDESSTCCFTFNIKVPK